MKRFYITIFILIILSFCGISVYAQTDKPKVIRFTAPKYPAAARAVRAAGTVIVSAKINGEGKVISAVAESGHPLLRKACETAAKEWIFSTDTNDAQFINITFLLRTGNKNKRDKVKFKKPYTLELVGVKEKIVNTIDY